MNKIYENLTIVTGLYDSSELINDLLKNLINFKVIIVDNGNNERVLKKLLHFKNIKIISQKKNLGYGKAINFAFKNIQSKYFFVLNPDLVISEKSIYDFYTLITKNPDAGIVAPITEPDKDFYGLFPEKNTEEKFKTKIFVLHWKFEKFNKAVALDQDYYEKKFINYLLYKSGCGREERLREIWR